MSIFQKRQPGFTIIELLIVIVIIAILAAITLVGYSSIQQRANNVARIANANAAVKLLTAYITTYGAYPYTGNTSCIGNGFANNNTYCWGTDSSTPATRSAALNDTELVKIGSLPNNTTPPVQTPSWKGLGPVYVYSSAYTLDGAPHPLYILYFLDGANQDCGINGVANRTDANNWKTVTTSPKNSGNSGNATVCYVAVTGP